MNKSKNYKIFFINWLQFGSVFEKNIHQILKNIQIENTQIYPVKRFICQNLYLDLE